MKKSLLAVLLGGALVAGSVSAHEAGSVIVRAGGVLVEPHAKTNSDVFKFDVNSNAQLGLTATYMVTDNIGVELLAATPFSHQITLGDIKIAKTKHLPPSLYAQYYFLDKDAKARPYLGAGVNYTKFFSTKVQYAPVKDLKLKDSWGPIVNAGVDIEVAKNLYLNAAVSYAKIKTKAQFKIGTDAYDVKVKLDPMIYFAGLAYKF